MEDKIDKKDIRIETINKSHGEIIKNFKTENKELKDFLVEDALRNQELAISTTYLWFYRPTNEVLAYVTLLADAIRIHGTHLQFPFTDKGVPYKTLPAVKIGRLCVNDRFRRRGIGTLTTMFTMEMVLKTSDHVGCRFIVVDAKRDSIHFYKKMGFFILKQREKGTIPIYYDMIKLIEMHREGRIKIS